MFPSVAVQLVVTVILLLSLSFGSAQGDDTEAAILKLADYFANSTLSREERIDELRWFVEASQPFRGFSIRS
jgi:glycerol transport system substrate-binding protein